MKHIANILSGGFDENKRLPDYVLSRIEHCLRSIDEFDAVLISSRYTRNVPIRLMDDKFPLYENEAIAAVLKEHGWNKPIYLESSSTDTLGGALFGRQYLETLGCEESCLTVITSKFHIERAGLMYRWALGLNKASQITLRFQCSDFCEGTSDRAERETEAIKFFKNHWENVKDFGTAFSLLLTHHNDYSVRRKQLNLSSLGMY